MLGKRKATAAALEVGKKPKNHGGKRQGTGPKPTPTNAPGSDAPDAPKRKQATLSDLLGARREAQKKTTETEAVVVVDLDAEEAPQSSRRRVRRRRVRRRRAQGRRARECCLWVPVWAMSVELT